MVSQWDCCELGAIETTDHVLHLGRVANQVWNMASVALGINQMEGLSWWETIQGWFVYAKKSSHKGTLLGLLPSIIT